MSIDLEMTRKHYALLRKYWHAGRAGLASHGQSVALDLSAAGYLQLLPSGGGLLLGISQRGIEALQAETEREKERRSPHHHMASRLAEWLRGHGRITWENIELLVPAPEGGRQAIRPDVFSLAATYDEKRLNPCVHEIKVSRADFLADLAKPEKRGGYAQVAELVYYTAPADMIAVGEIPQECGLVIETTVGEFSIVKRPKKKKVDLTSHHFMNLILKGGTVNPP